MYGMAQAVADLVEQGAPAFETALPMLSQLLKAEMAEREVRSIAYHMKVAPPPWASDQWRSMDGAPHTRISPASILPPARSTR